LAEVKKVEGQAGDFKVQVVQKPRYVDMSKCIACGQCAEKCPSKVDDEFNQGLAKRKAIYVQYAQAVPLKYAIDNTVSISKKANVRHVKSFARLVLLILKIRKKNLHLKWVL
jgi:heterodisulfide reductase subunit A